MSQEQKVGTFSCWLFGHRFVGKFTDWSEKDHDYAVVSKVLQHCVRCGIERQALKSQQDGRDKGC